MGTGMMGGMTGWMMSWGMDAQMMRDMRVIHDLRVRHERIERRVEDIRGRIRAVRAMRPTPLPPGYHG